MTHTPPALIYVEWLHEKFPNVPRKGWIRGLTSLSEAPGVLPSARTNNQAFELKSTRTRSPRPQSGERGRGAGRRMDSLYVKKRRSFMRRPLLDRPVDRLHGEPQGCHNGYQGRSPNLLGNRKQTRNYVLRRICRERSAIDQADRASACLSFRPSLLEGILNNSSCGRSSCNQLLTKFSARAKRLVLHFRSLEAFFTRISE